MKKVNLNTLVHQIRAADMSQVESQFKIAKLLTIIRDTKLYEDGYNSMKMCIAGEFEFAPTTGAAYISLYHHYTRLKYSEAEFLRLMQQFSWRKILIAIRGSKTKIGYRKIKSILTELDAGRDSQFHFEIPDKDANRLIQTLARFGAESNTATGRRSNMSRAMVALLDDYERLSKSRKGRDPKLRAVG